MKKSKKSFYTMTLLCVLFICFTFPAYAENEPFTDVATDNQYREVIINLYNDEIIFGVEKGMFYPERDITLGEYYTLLCRLNDKNIPANNNNKHWAYSAAAEIRNHVSSGYIHYFDEAFLDYPISKADAVVIGMQYFGYQFPVSENLLDNPFVDLNKPGIKMSVKGNYLLNAYYLGIISPTDSTHISPECKLSRAEACYIVNNMKNANLSDNTQALTPDILDKVTIKYIGESSATYDNDLADALSLFPDEIINQFAKSGGTIIVTDEAQSTYVDDNRPATGCYLPDTKAVVCFTNGRPSSFMFSLLGTVQHELGHFIYYELLTAEEKDQIKDSFLSDELNDFAETVGSNYCKTNEAEYFAEFVEYTISYNTAMQEKIKNIDFEHMLDIYNKYLTK